MLNPNEKFIDLKNKCEELNYLETYYKNLNDKIQRTHKKMEKLQCKINCFNEKKKNLRAKINVKYTEYTCNEESCRFQKTHLNGLCPDKFCEICDEIGHVDWACNKICEFHECLKKNLPKHRISQCIVKCQYCDLNGHNHYACPKQYCPICKEFGNHAEMTCPYTKIYCYICNKYNHNTDNCPGHCLCSNWPNKRIHSNFECPLLNLQTK